MSLNRNIYAHLLQFVRELKKTLNEGLCYSSGEKRGYPRAVRLCVFLVPQVVHFTSGTGNVSLNFQDIWMKAKYLIGLLLAILILVVLSSYILAYLVVHPSQSVRAGWPQKLADWNMDETASPLSRH